MLGRAEFRDKETSEDMADFNEGKHCKHMA